MNPTAAPRSKPAHEVRFGSIKATIWRNETENGHRFNTTFARIYKDGDQWHNTDSFGREDLLLLAKVADQAHSWIHAQARENPAEPSPSTAPPASATPPATRTAQAYNRARPTRDAG